MKSLVKEYLHTTLVLGKLDKVDQFLHPHFTSITPIWEDRLTLKTHLKFTKLIVMAFENIHIEWKELIYDEASNKVFINYVFKAVHVNDILNFKAYHKGIRVDVGAIYHFSQEKIFFEKTFFDIYSLIEQMKE
jgi:hypothetical protein